MTWNQVEQTAQNRIRWKTAVEALCFSQSEEGKPYASVRAKRTMHLLSLVLICRRRTWDMAAGTAWGNCGICEHLSPTQNLSQALTTACLRSWAKFNFAGKPAINVWDGLCVGDKCSHMPQRCPASRAGGHSVPGRWAAYENQALGVKIFQAMLTKQGHVTS